MNKQVLRLQKELDEANQRADFIAKGWEKQIAPYVKEYQKVFGNVYPDARGLLEWKSKIIKEQEKIIREYPEKIAELLNQVVLKGESFKQLRKRLK